MNQERVQTSNSERVPAETVPAQPDPFDELLRSFAPPAPPSTAAASADAVWQTALDEVRQADPARFVERTRFEQQGQ